jgi:hypothetical protein
MNILKSIKNWFSTETTHSSKSNKTDTKNSITFSIDGFGRPWIALSIENTNDKSCEEFAKMLFHINDGFYEENTLDLIVSLAKDKPDIALALETILISWGMLLATEDQEPKNKTSKNTENRPFIRPRNVFLGSNK